MIFPENFEHKIEFDSIRQTVLALCTSYYGRKAAESMHFSKDYEVVKRMLSETAEMLDIIKGKEDYPSFNSIDVAPWLGELRSEGGYVTAKNTLTFCV